MHAVHLNTVSVFKFGEHPGHVTRMGFIFAVMLYSEGFTQTSCITKFVSYLKYTIVKCMLKSEHQYSISLFLNSVQLLSPVKLFVTPWIAACQASLSITNSQSLSKLMCIELVMASSHLILCRPLLLLPPIPPSIRVFYSESTLRMRWPKYWSFSLSIIPTKERPGPISFKMDWLDLLAV